MERKPSLSSTASTDSSMTSWAVTLTNLALNEPDESCEDLRDGTGAPEDDLPRGPDPATSSLPLPDPAGTARMKTAERGSNCIRSEKGLQKPCLPELEKLDKESTASARREETHERHAQHVYRF